MGFSLAPRYISGKPMEPGFIGKNSSISSSIVVGSCDMARRREVRIHNIYGHQMVWSWVCTKGLGRQDMDDILTSSCTMLDGS